MHCIVLLYTIYPLIFLDYLLFRLLINIQDPSINFGLAIREKNTKPKLIPKKCEKETQNKGTLSND